MRHYTSRAGDPHRHLHLQINARVFAAGKWRGLHTVGVRDFLARDQRDRARRGRQRPAIPGRAGRARLHPRRRLEKYWSSPSTWARSARGPRRSAATWTATNGNGRPRTPARHPGPALRRAWDARAWAEGRPDKVTPQPGRGPHRAVAGRARRPRLPRPRPARRPGAHPGRRAGPGRRRGAGAGPAGRRPLGVERRRHPRRGRAADRRRRASSPTPAVRIELAEDLTARALAVRAAAGPGRACPEHIRAWTSQPVLDVEADLTARLAARSAPRHRSTPPVDLAGAPLPCRAAGRRSGGGGRRAGRRPAAGRGRGRGRRGQDHHPGRHPAACSRRRGAGWWW